MGSLCTPSIVIRIHVFFSHMKNKNYKQQKTKEIVSTFCALLNSHGGKITMEFEAATESDVQNLKRAIEQRLSDVLGFSSIRDHIETQLVSSSIDELVYAVEGVSSLCTLNYNLYLPSETQVLAVSPKTPIADVGEMLSSEKRIGEVEGLIEIGTHCKKFFFRQFVNATILSESKEVQLKCLKEERVSKTVQFKKLKAEKSKCVTLGDRMTNKANKFANYVSAFANHRGGHIYYGVQDDGVVKGELVEDKEEITKKVSKAINKMVWPTECEGPKRGQHWEIFFEPVSDAKGNDVPSTFVIVVFIARCTGGVFTKEPESYHVIDGEVKKMEYNKWRERFFQTTLPQHVALVQWSSKKMERRFHCLMEKLIYLKNNGNKEDFERFVDQVMKDCSSNGVHLAILSQKAALASRKDELRKAETSIKQYEDVLSRDGNNDDFMLFHCLGVYIKSTKQRAAGNYKESYDLATICLENVESIPPGLCSAMFYLHAASVLSRLTWENACEESSTRDEVMLAKTFYAKALEHINHVSGFPKTVVDVQQNIYIHVAALYLSCSMNGTMKVTAVISGDDITRAKNCFMMVNNLILEGHALSSVRQIRYCLAQSGLFLRQSQLSTSTHQLCRSQLESSLWYSKKALNLALECKFGEMVVSCRQRIACVTEEIVRDWFRNLKSKKKQELVEE